MRSILFICYFYLKRLFKQNLLSCFERMIRPQRMNWEIVFPSMYGAVRNRSFKREIKYSSKNIIKVRHVIHISSSKFIQIERVSCERCRYFQRWWSKDPIRSIFPQPFLLSSPKKLQFLMHMPWFLKRKSFDFLLRIYSE